MMNKEKKALNLIVKREIKSNKIFSSLVLVAILLSTVLLMGAILISNQMEKVNSTRLGTWTAMYQDIDDSIVKKLTNEKNILDYGVSTYIETKQWQESKINISYADKNAMELCGLPLKSGKMPSKDDEILIEDGMENQKGEKIKIGDRININFGGKKEMIVCGTFSSSASNMSKKIYGVFVFKGYVAGRKDLQQTLYLSMDSIEKKEVSRELQQLAEKYNLDNQFTVNEDYLNAKGKGWIYKLAAIGMSLIILTLAYLTIYCIFFISVVNNVKEYGQLRLVGVTNKQVRYITNHKFLKLLAVGVPLGGAIGGVIGYLVIPEAFSLLTYIIIMAMVSVLMVIMVLMAERRPLKIIKSISIIESSKFNGIEKIKERKKKKHITPRAMATLYIDRYKRKVNLTISLLVLCGTMVIVCSSILNALDAKAMSKQNFLYENYHITINENLLREMPLEKVQLNNPLTDDLISDLKEIEGVQDIWIQMYLPFSIEKSEEESSGAIVSFSKRDYKRLEKCLIEGELPAYDEDKNDIIIGRPEQFEKTFGIRAKCGDSLDIYVYDGGNKEKIRLNVVGILDEDKSAKEKFDMLMMPDNNIQSVVNTNTNDTVFIKTTEDEIVDQRISTVCTAVEDKIRVESLEDVIEQNEMFMFSFKIIIYVILAFLAVFAIVNLLNTLLTNIVVRKKEFKTMQMVGMTIHQLKQMLMWEGMIIVLKSLILVCLIGILISKVICTMMMNSGFSYMTYRIPIFTILVYLIVSGAFALLGTGIIGVKLLFHNPNRKEKV